MLSTLVFNHWTFQDVCPWRSHRQGLQSICKTMLSSHWLHRLSVIRSPLKSAVQQLLIYHKKTASNCTCPKLPPATFLFCSSPSAVLLTFQKQSSIQSALRKCCCCSREHLQPNNGSSSWQPQPLHIDYVSWANVQRAPWQWLEGCCCSFNQNIPVEEPRPFILDILLNKKKV